MKQLRLLSKWICLSLFFLFILSVSFLLGSQSLSSPDLTEAEKDWLDEHPVIKIAPDPDFPPTEFFDEAGIYRGLAADFISQIESFLRIRFEIVRLENWDECIDKARSREIDMFGAAAMTVQRNEFMLFTRPYLEFPAVIIVNENFSGNLSLNRMEGMKIAVASGYAVHDYLILNYPGLDLHPVEDIRSGLLKVSFGEVDAFVGNIATATHAINSEGITNLRLAGETGYSLSLSMAVRSDWPELRQILDKALSSISEKKKQVIFNKWVNISHAGIFENKIFRIIFISGAAGIVVIFVFILLWNQMLKSQVNKRTEELDDQLKQKEQALELLENSENRYSTLANNIPGAVYRSRADRLFSMMIISPAIEEISGYPLSDFLDNRNRTYDSIICEEDRKAVEAVRSECLRDKSPFMTEYRINHGDGDVRWVSERGRGIYAEDGSLLFVDGVIFDMTEQKRTEEQLRQTQKMEMIGVLASGFAHDFNNVLGGITATVSTMKHKISRTGSIDRNKLNEYLDVLRDCGERASRIVRQLLTLSRKKDLVFRPADLNDLISNVVKIGKISFDKSVSVQVIPYGGPARAFVDSSQIEQALLNLCINAVHSMTIMREDQRSWGGALTISLAFSTEEGDRDFWVISVNDEGVGIDEREMANLFDPFYTTKMEGKGMGLGLTMVSNIIKAHRGFIDIHSSPGKGSTFNIYLPVFEEPVSAEISGSDVTEYSGSGRILVVDDESLMRRASGEILRECGYDVLMAENGYEALDLYRREGDRIDAVVLDLMMPDISGIKTYEELRRIDPRVRVLLVSGFRENERIDELLDAGVKGFIQKPFTLEKLALALRDILKGD